LKVAGKDQSKEGECDEAARKLDTARSLFYNGVRLKADLLHARGGSRARYGTIKGKSFRRVRRAGRISRAPDEPQCTLESEYPGITAGWRRRILSSYLSSFSLSTLSVGLFMKYKFRVSHCVRTRARNIGCGRAADISGIIPAADVSEVVVS